MKKSRILLSGILAVLVLSSASCSNSTQPTDMEEKSTVQSSIVEFEQVSKIESSSDAEKSSEVVKENSEKSSDESEQASKTESSSDKELSSLPEKIESENGSETVSKMESSFTAESSLVVESTVSHEENSVVPEESKQVSKAESSSHTEPSATIEKPIKFPDKWKDGGIFSSKYEKAYEIVKNMTLEEKIGQLMLARCPESDGISEAKKYHLGGYVLFGRDFEGSRDSITNNISGYLSSQDIPMIIAVDEEGGTVSRLSWNDELTDHKFLSPRKLYDNGGIDAIINEAQEKDILMKSLNINTNLAPVCDISTDENDFMYYRSLGQSADITSDFISKYTIACQQDGISVALKHFPGYGNNVDTHNGIAIDKRSYENFEKNDFLPFKAGINAGAHMVLVSHNIVECMDKDHPASLSSEVHRVLRDELGFTGIIITDDLEMDAVSKYVTGYSVVEAAVIAGNDMLCVSDYETACSELKEAVNNGTIEEEVIEHAATRVIAWKMTKNMM